MKPPFRFDTRDMARTIGGFSTIEQVIKDEREQRERLFRLHAASAVADLFRSAEHASTGETPWCTDP